VVLAKGRSQRVTRFGVKPDIDAKIATILWYITTIRIAAAQVQRLAAEFLLQMASRNEGANWQDPRKTWPSAMPAQPFREN
jgi:hypothetical protein